MTFRHEAHKVCVVARSYPRSFLWGWFAGTVAAGVAGNNWFFVPLLTLLFITMCHVFNRMWSPPVYISFRGRDVLGPGEREGRHVKRET